MLLSKLSRSLCLVVAVLLVNVQASAASLEDSLSRFVTENEFNGVILVARKGEVLHHRAYGHADFEAGTPTALTTRYQLGSISKYVASLVVLKLVDEKKLSLTRPISDYLPAYRKDVGAKVTLHHLLSHTSGVPSDIVAAYRANKDIAKVELPVATAVERYASGELLFEPGARFDYSHSNWILVRAIIESASGRSYEENVQRLLAPLKLKDTGIFSGDFSTIPGGAMGYKAVKPEPQRSPEPLPTYMACAGGLYGTAADLLTLTRAIHDGKVVSKASLQKLTTPYVADEGYAYGGRVRTLKLGGRDEVIDWNTGSSGPYKSRVSHAPSSGLTVIFLSNTNMHPGKTGAATEEVLQLLAAEPRGKSKR
ncbi:serine hydrolase domain-containing protein [Pyxidicoccus sp. 3LFB2]